MKKTFLILLAVAVAIPVYAQDDSWEYNRRSAVTFNPGAFIIGTSMEGFGIGAAYEYAPIERFSVKANGYYLGYTPQEIINYSEKNIDGLTSMVMFALEGRWYPLEHFVEGVFINAGLQYHLLAGTIGFYDYDNEQNRRYNGAYHTVGIFGGLGYKVVFGRNRFGLALEPTIDYIWPFYSTIPYRDDAINHESLAMSAMGIKGVRIGLQVGMAF